jgi:hypothetical protein
MSFLLGQDLDKLFRVGVAVCVILLISVLYMRLEEEKKQREAAEKQRDEEKKQREAAEKQREAAEKQRDEEKKLRMFETKRKDAEIDLIRLSGKHLEGRTVYDRVLTDLEILEKVEMSRNLLQNVTKIVKEFNDDPSPTVERSRSIGISRSVHYLWSQLFECIRESDPTPKSTDCVTRIMYECSIPHLDNSNASLQMDFSFISSEVRSLSWTQLRGGLELKNNPRYDHNSSEGKGNLHEGYKQAVSRCAFCMRSRADARAWRIGKDGERVFMLYGDGRRVGLVLLTLDAALDIAVTHFAPMDLPGFNGSTNATPLKLLKFVLTSSESDLGPIMSPLMRLNERKIAGVLRGDSDDSPLTECEWEAGTLLGQGGFGYVCAVADTGSGHGESTFPVIKATLLPSNYARLKSEMKVLDRLANMVSATASIPRCIGALSVSRSDDRVCALKLSERGVSLPHYVRSLLQEPDHHHHHHSLLASLVRVLGPAMVDALQAVHSCRICHCDVRPPNIILVPPAAVMAEIAKLGGDIAERRLVAKIDVSATRCLLNDWGEAKEYSKSKDEALQNQKKVDLEGLVQALANPAHLVRGSEVSNSDSSDAVQSSEPGGRHGTWWLDKVTEGTLRGSARQLEYTNLRDALASLK